ncbi:CCHC-type zinc finger protein [Armadillidium vulgare]|nr:CCHC-type zinc finger protein [Armadillidium vulgare]
MKVVECCSKCLSSDHYSDDCSKVHGKAKSGSCRNCKDPNHTFWTCEKECKFCPDNTDGHMRKDCTKAGHCHNCGKSGHYAYRCEEKCKYCNNNSDGHVRKDCQKPTLGKTCFNCNQNGHILKDCPDKEQE